MTIHARSLQIVGALAIMLLLGGCARQQHGSQATPTAQRAARSAVAAESTATAVVAPTVAPTPTPDPALLAQQRDAALADGDYLLAITLGEQLTMLAPEEERARHYLALARSYLPEGRHAEGAQSLISAFEAAPDDDLRTEALGMLGNLYGSLGQWRGTIDIYQRYLALDGEAAGYVRFELAMAHKALGEDAQAQEALLAIDLTTLPASKRAQVLQELGDARRRLSDVDGALAAYGEILGFAQNRAYRGQIESLIAQTLLDSERKAEAYTAYERILQEYGGVQAAAQALQALDEAKKVKLDDLARARVYYDAGQYPVAVEALLRYLKQPRPASKLEAQYYLGQAYAQQRDYARAFEAFDAALETFDKASAAEREKQLPLLGQVWMAKGLAVARYGGDAASIYYEFWRQYPAHPLAADALYLAASWAETEIGWATAGEYYHRFQRLYPTDVRLREATFREGLAAYVEGRPGQAVTLWSALLMELPESAIGDRARVLTWLGLAARALGDEAAAQGLWAQASALAPELYYGLRAQDLALGVRPQVRSAPHRALPAPELAEEDWQEIERWVGSWYTATLPLTDTVRIQGWERRGRALRRIGWHTDADAAYREASQLLNDHPTGLADLAWRCSEEGVYAYAIAAAVRLINLGRAAGAEPAPVALWRVAYPTHFGHLVQPEAERYGFDPLLFMALMRQESRYDARAVSYAGATGLTQVMPATGAWIAGRINDGSYRHELLTRPIVSVRYGMWYLNMLLQEYQGDWVAALVGYNAGPGNLARWANGQPIADHDLFYEMIPNQQAKDYVRLIYQQYRVYQRIYGEVEERAPHREAMP